jgi:hypothetical protein
MITRKRTRELAMEQSTETTARGRDMAALKPLVSKKRTRSEVETATAPPPRKRAKKVKAEEVEVPAPPPAVSTTKAQGRNQGGSNKSRKRTREEEPELPSQESIKGTEVTASIPAVVEKATQGSKPSATPERNLTRPPPRKRVKTAKAQEAEALRFLKASGADFVDGKGQGGPKSLAQAREDDPTVMAI